MISCHCHVIAGRMQILGQRVDYDFWVLQHISTAVIIRNSVKTIYVSKHDIGEKKVKLPM
jgi:hypothetical protein